MVVPSDSLIPTDDKTLLFTSAGMVQFKRNFLGQSKDSFTRATSCQKCFRTSDIEQVGLTTRHLTFFEMLGNFSFGDYFKNEAIAWAWEFATKNLSLPKNRLFITVYKIDDEAFRIWKKFVPESKIIRMDDKTNFWNMGDSGPCGPCSEILIDLGYEVGCGKSICGPSCDCGRYLEIWNLVFTQYDKQLDNSLKDLSKKNIDTGMGLERIVVATSNKKSIFETDLFVPIIKNTIEILKIKDKNMGVSRLRVIADHARAVTFLISDGVLPSNDGRGYVLRRILRRALRQGRFYNCNKPFINELISTVFKIMKPAYPELSSKLSNIQYIVKKEEEKFLETLEAGSEILSNIISSYKARLINVVDGKDIFKLYDTYGFPYDLTKEIVYESGLLVDEVGFKTEQKAAQNKSRTSWSGAGEKDITFYSLVYMRVNDTIFVGYEKYISEGKVLVMVKNAEEVSELSAGEEGEIILSQTSFYAQSGGQNADKGKMLNNSFEAEVKDVFKPIGNLFVHKIKVVKGLIKIGEDVVTVIDIEHRKQIARHHTATHILHKVLREFFGQHVIQAGSLIVSDYLRFDFTHFSAIKKEDLTKIEKKINSIIRANFEVHIESMDINQARSAGAMALFGEKYGNIVRTVSIKDKNSKNNYSMELCGGTHIDKTGDIGIFKIISETSISTGVRRIEAVVGIAAEDYILEEESLVDRMTEILNVTKEGIVNKIQKCIANCKKLENDCNLLRNNFILGEIDSYVKQVQEINRIKILFISLDNVDVKILRNMSDQLKQKLKSIVLVIASNNKNKASFIVSVTADYIKEGIEAVKIAKIFALGINGYGGGKSDFAQGGSKSLSKIEIAIRNVTQYIQTI
jgi:alanyl-tRNA synthetase